MASHRCTSLPERSFWRSAVAGRDPLDIADCERRSGPSSRTASASGVLRSFFDNLRAVRPEGVTLLTGHIFRALRGEPAPTPHTHPRPPSTAAERSSSRDDALLGYYGAARCPLLGDSRAACVGRAARATGTALSRRSVRAGDFQCPFFDTGGTEIRFRAPERRPLFGKFLDAPGTGGSQGRRCRWCAPSGSASTRCGHPAGLRRPRDRNSDSRRPSCAARSSRPWCGPWSARAHLLRAHGRDRSTGGGGHAAAARRGRQRGVETTDLRARMTGRSGCLPDDRIQGNPAVGRL